MPSGTMDTSYLSTQVSTIIRELHGLFDEIGVPSHERDSREAEVCSALSSRDCTNNSQLFTALSEALNNQLRIVKT
jgi:Ase1/PRC1/MAP65 family protein